MAEIRRVPVWSGWTRVSHGCIGLAVLVALFTGWLIAESPSLQDLALDIHYLAAGVLLFGLVVRAVGLFRAEPHERLTALVPTGTEAAAIVQTLRCYLSFGRLPLPGWYAHNPLWKALYLLIYPVLAILAASGAAMPDVSIVFGFYLPSVHAFWAQVVLWFTVLHIASVILHDYKNQSADVSAMINGYRVFVINTDRAGPTAGGTHQHISPDSIGGKN